MKKLSVRLLSGVCVAVALAATPLLANHSWGGYHWARTSNSFTLQLGDNLTTADWKGHLSQTSQDWNAGNTPVQTQVVVGLSTKRCKMVAGTTQVCNGTYGFNGWLGLATISIMPDKHITQGSAKMNDSYFNTATYNNPNEREHVMCQEVAHTFGLAHQDETGISLDTCMDYFSNTGANATSTKSTKPNRHDFDELNTIYGHLDTTTTLASSAAASTGVDVDEGDPNSWGQLMSQSKNGRSSTYERANRDGSFTLTHVFWTEEAATNCPSCDHRFDR